MFLLLLGGFTACGKDQPIQGFELTDPNRRGVVDSSSVNDVAFELSYADTLIPTGVFGTSLLLGSFGDTETRILLRFDNIPDTLEITNAAIILRTNGIVGRTKTSFMASVHQVLEDWKESTVTSNNFQNNLDANPIASAEIIAVDRVFDENDSLIVEAVRFQLDDQGVELVRNWADTTDAIPNYGVLLDFSNSEFIKSFFTLANATNRPELELEVMSDTTSQTRSIAASADAYLPRYLVTPPPGPLYVDHLFGSHAIVKFDLSAIRRESTVNRASLRLTIDRANTLITDSQFSLQILRLLKPFTEPDSLVLDGEFVVSAGVTQSQSTVSISAEQARGNFRRIVQDWVTGQVENNGLMIRSFTPGLSISRIAVVAAGIDSARAPSVSVDYSVAPIILNSN